MINNDKGINMEFTEKLTALSGKIRQQKDSIQTEEATKTAFLLPFIGQVLGYDIFDPSEVIPEYTADVGIKKGEKVDYAIMHNGELQILIEAKKINEDLSVHHSAQLFRYFTTTTAKLAILTNGQIYKFYTDLDSPNKMDEKPFLEIDLLELDDLAISELRKLAKNNFDVESVLNSAGELKYLNAIKKILGAQLKEPEDDFMRVFISRVYDGQITQKVREQFSPLIIKAFSQFINDRINARLKSAMAGDVEVKPVLSSDATETQEDDQDKDDGIVTTLEEIEGFNIVKAIVRKHIDPNKIVARDTKSYFGILYDDNNRKPICRLHFNRAQKYIETFDENKESVRHPITSVDEIFDFEDQLVAVALSYE